MNSTQAATEQSRPIPRPSLAFEFVASSENERNVDRSIFDPDAPWSRSSVARTKPLHVEKGIEDFFRAPMLLEQPATIRIEARPLTIIRTGRRLHRRFFFARPPCSGGTDHGVRPNSLLPGARRERVNGMGTELPEALRLGRKTLTRMQIVRVGSGQSGSRKC